MQGSVFTSFSDMVIEKMGIVTWNELLIKVKPCSKGIYTNAMLYQDSELMDLVTELSKKMKIEVEDLLRIFGGYLFIRLYNASPANLTKVDNLKDFLLIIDSVIHKEVKRVYPTAYLPTFDYAENAQGDLVMHYQSKRKLCHLAEGLILGAAEHFNQIITIQQQECMHNGADKCKLTISFKEK
ncbi:guanylate cyclase [Colwellia sp. 39_35_sub15_T18]|nr:guanylate cyclase [Colwellia sp. 39_35_sub15_T18]